ncbi:MAG: exosome complex protein Rrp42, partial [Candidatus Heimdallarchaeota archaeon]|nr:exosome complex protein Rrp42 [Candidatus Heimdallarchaeota archaeon]
MRKEEIVGDLERTYIRDLLEKGERIDGRGFMDGRSIQIIPNVIKKAEGSAMVKWGETVVLAGVKTQLGTPFPDTPNTGVITVNVELSPISSPINESGPPGPQAIELARVVDRGIRESKVIPMEDPKLCIIPGKKVWIIFVDIYVIDDGGNLFDASAFAAMAALANTRLKQVVIDEDLEEVTKLDETEPLPRNGSVTGLTFVKMNDTIFYDPNLIEDRVKEARFSIAVTDQNIVCSMQKGESGTFTQSEIETILENAQTIVKPLLAKIDEFSQVSEVNEMFR